MRNISLAHRENMRLPHFRSVLLAGATIVCAATSLGASSATAKTIKFDAPGATDTTVFAMNDNGEIVGSFLPQGMSFLREPDGTITTFKIKGSDTTEARGINDKGQITGSDSKEEPSCFLRNRNGKAVSCTPLGESEAFGNAINVHGVVTGGCFDRNTGFHGFIFDGEGSTVFDAPGAIFTDAESINANGFVSGHSIDAAGVVHGFVRDAGGTITEFVVPGATVTDGFSINDSGTVAGYYSGDDGHNHSFIRAADGTITVFDPAGAVFSQAVGINKKGVIIGYWNDGQFVYGYVRSANGVIKSFAVHPIGVQTLPVAINSKGEIAGTWVDGIIEREHGFLRTP